MQSSSSPERLLTGGDEIAALAERLERCSVIAVDTEMDSYFSYQTKLCLIQISSEHEDALIDPLAPVDLSVLRKIFENPSITKILHAADNDVPYLVERVGGKVGPIFDTHAAAKILGLPRAGLSWLLQDFLNIEVDKTFQRADWRLRPLPQAQFDYARSDTRYLIKLWQIMHDMLIQQELYQEARAAFQRIQQNPPQPRKFNPDAYLHLTDARKLNAWQKARLRDLYAWREQIACQQDEAVFRILPDGLLIPLALFNDDVAAMRATFRHHTVQNHANQILEITEKSQYNPFQPQVVATPAPLLNRLQSQHYEKLRQWRNDLAEKLSLAPERIFTNRSLKALILQKPCSQAALTEVEGMEEWRLAKFGQALWHNYTSLQCSKRN